MGWSNYNYYNDNADRGASDEYYTEYCNCCGKVTEHDICTDKCVEYHKE
jgi:hypothetical protein